MFELDDRIEHWKNGLRLRETLRNDDIAELEQHVRDSIAESMTRGLSEEESFWVATGRIGETGPLACEFDKVNEGLVRTQRLFWMLGGFLVFEVCRLMIQAVGSLAQSLTAAVGGNGIVMGWVGAGLTCVAWCATLWFLYRSGGSRDGANLLGRFLANSPGITIGVCVGAALVLIGAFWAGNLFLIRQFGNPRDFGQAAMISQYVSLALAILLPLVCLFAIVAVRRRFGGFQKQEH